VNPVLRFLGGTRTVTGSRFLVDVDGSRVLVDCGLYQGAKELRLRNWDPFPFDPGRLDAVVLTHAHVDHCGFLPALVRDGFNGAVWSTPGTRSLCRIVLPDSARLHEEDAAYANRKRFSKHRPALPLYTQDDAAAALGLFREAPFGSPVAVTDSVSFTCRRAGHILGSAGIALDVATDSGTRSLYFSGDLGRPVHPVLAPPEPPPRCDTLLVESTYGDRRHPDPPAVTPPAFRDAVLRTAERGGVVVIPAFAVDRTEVVLHHLRALVSTGEIPNLPTYADSPMALASLAVYRRAIADGTPDIRSDVAAAGAAEVDLFDPGRLIEARDVEASKAINDVKGPAIIVSASGMATGGRALHHLARRLGDRRNTVVLAGYQAPGTRGALLADGATEVKLLGHYVRVRAEIVDVPAFSVHADRDELIAWMGTAPEPPEITYVIHGEEEASLSLASAIETKLGWPAVVPRLGEMVRVD